MRRWVLWLRMWRLERLQRSGRFFSAANQWELDDLHVLLRQTPRVADPIRERFTRSTGYVPTWDYDQVER